MGDTLPKFTNQNGLVIVVAMALSLLMVAIDTPFVPSNEHDPTTVQNVTPELNEEVSPPNL